jgi:cation diffusion facilitator CzcD-associated flavoprotein CzcO
VYDTEQILCDKLIVATGLASSPRRSDLLGRDEFKGQFLEYTDILYDTEQSVCHDPSIKSVAVIGGSKSSYDAIFWTATAGKKVDWIIQNSGHGPHWTTPSFLRLFGLRMQFEKMTTTRFFSLFSPCIWGYADGYRWIRWLLHRTWLGRKMVDIMWSWIGDKILASSGLKDNQKAKYKLRPEVG